MDVPLLVVFLFFTSAGSTALETDFVNVTQVNQNGMELIFDQNGETITFHDEMQNMFATMSKSLDQKLATIVLELAESLQKLSASFHQNLSGFDSKMEMSHRNLSEEFSRKLSTFRSNVEVSLAGLSKTLGEELRRNQSNETNGNQQQVSHPIPDLAESLNSTQMANGQGDDSNKTLMRNHDYLSHSLSDFAASSNSSPVANGPMNLSKVDIQSHVTSSQSPAKAEVYFIRYMPSTNQRIDHPTLPREGYKPTGVKL